jgi:acyl carrier protein
MAARNLSFAARHGRRKIRLEEIYRKLTEIFRDVFDDDTIIVTPDLTADDVAEWDSLTHIRLILTVQKAFGVQFSAAQTAGLKNVGELARLVQSKAVAA